MQLAERVDMAHTMLVRRWQEWKIKRDLCKLYGVKKKQAARYLRVARARLLEELGRSKEEHQADAYGFYSAIVGDKNQKTGDRIDAQERIDKLLGLEAPSKHEHAGKDGGPLTLAALLVQSDQVPSPPRAGEPSNRFDVDRFLEAESGAD